LTKKALHEFMVERLGLKASHLVSEYGMSELSSQAYDRAVQEPGAGVNLSRRSFRFPPWARARIISTETGLDVREGETGVIVVHDLANVFSVAAIQTEDLAIRLQDGFELIGRRADAEARGCSLMNP
jgi:hypothetical protein